MTLVYIMPCAGVNPWQDFFGAGAHLTARPIPRWGLALPGAFADDIWGIWWRCLKLFSPPWPANIAELSENLSTGVDIWPEVVLNVNQRHGSHHPTGDGAPEIRTIFNNTAPRGTKTTTRCGQSTKPGQDRSRTHGGKES